MKKKVAEKVEMKENVLSGNALELNEADLEGVAGGNTRMEELMERGRRIQEEQNKVYGEDYNRRWEEMMRQESQAESSDSKIEELRQQMDRINKEIQEENIGYR